MKKQFISCLLAVAALLLPTALSAQPASWAGHLAATPPQDGDGVVRKWNDNYVVAAYRHGGKQCLSCVKIADFLSDTPGAIVNSSADTAEVSDSLTILDMRILDDTVFFCGSWDGDAAWGWTPLPFPPAVHVHSIPSPITRLDRMAVYRDGGAPHVVALGSNALNSFIVEVADAVRDTLQVNVARMNIVSPDQRDRLDDIAELDGLIVVTGRDTRAGTATVSVRMADKATGFIPSPGLTSQFRFLVAGASLTGPVLATRSDAAPYFAIACSWRSAADNSTGLRLHRMLPAGLASLQVAGAQDVAPTRDVVLQEMTFLDNDRVLLMTQRAEPMTTFLPLTLTAAATYSTYVYSQYGVHFGSVARLGGSAFAAWGDTFNLYLQKASAVSLTCLGVGGVDPAPAPAATVSRVNDPPTKLKFTVVGHCVSASTGWQIVPADCNITF